MKKISIFLNVMLALFFIWIMYDLVSSCITLSYDVQTYLFLSEIESDEASFYKNYIVQNSITVAFDAIMTVASVISLFLFNHRFNGVSLREKVAVRLTESKEKRTQYKAEKAEADRQKRLEALQSEIDKLKKE